MEEKKFLDLNQPAKPKEIFVPELNAYVRYCSLTFKELSKLTEYPNDVEKGFYFLSVALSKVDPRVTFESVQQLPGNVYLALMKAICENEGFKFFDMKK